MDRRSVRPDDRRGTNSHAVTAMEMRPFGHLVSVEQACRRLLRAAVPVGSEESIPLADAVGRIAAETVRAPAPVPPVDRATWDGYAFASSSTRAASPARPVTMPIVGEVFADQRFRRSVPRGSAVAIATGGEVPRGTDTLEIFERVRRHGSRIRIDHPVRPGRYIAHVGDDFAQGALLARKEEPLLPSALGSVAAAGWPRIRVYRAPVVAIVPNGNELLSPGARPRPHHIYESNNATLSAIVRAAGGIPRPMRPVVDDPGLIEETLRRAARSSDVVIATGGSSVGEHDYLPRIFPRLGKLLFHGIAVRPGKPTLAARSRRTLFVGMPGHPTSCLANGFWLLLPALRRMARLPGPGWVDQSIRLASDADRLTPGLATVVPIRVEGHRGHPTFHDSHAITSLSGVNAFAILPPGNRAVRRGEHLVVHRLLPPLGDPAFPAPANR